MKGNLRWPSLAAWMLMFVILDLAPFKGRASWLDSADFTFAFILAAAFFIKGFGMAVAAFAAGVVLDSFSPVPVHTPLFVGAYYSARLLERLFYYPGSPVHVLTFIPVLFLGPVVEYLASGGGLRFSGAPAAAIMEAGAAGCVVFLLMLALYRKRDKAVMYKMR